MAGLCAKKAEAKKESHVKDMVDVMELAASSELHPQFSEAMRKFYTAIYAVWSFHIVDLRSFVDKYQLTHG